MASVRQCIALGSRGNAAVVGLADAEKGDSAGEDESVAVVEKRWKINREPDRLVRLLSQIGSVHREGMEKQQREQHGGDEEF